MGRVDYRINTSFYVFYDFQIDRYFGLKLILSNTIMGKSWVLIMSWSFGALKYRIENVMQQWKSMITCNQEIRQTLKLPKKVNFEGKK